MTGAHLTGVHDLPLVALSIVLAILASYSALDLAGRMRAAVGRAGLLWLCAAAVAMGGGIWAMHYVAMLAFIFPLPVAHDARLTAISFVLPILVTGLGFAVVRRRAGRHVDTVLGGIFVGCGIAAMHYTGMAAMQVPAELHYDLLYVVASVLIAIGAATFALWLAQRETGLPVMLGAAAVMGLAVAGMHFTGMAAASWVPLDTPTGRHASHATHGASAIESAGLAVGVAAATFLILSLALLAALIDRRFSALGQREAALALRESEARADALAVERVAILAQLAEGVIVTDLSGRITFANEAAERIHGGVPLLGVMPEAYSRTFGLHRPDGQPYPSEELPLARAVRHHETVENARWRIRRPDGSEVLAIGSARPVRRADGSLLGAVLTLRDETARADAEAALRESEARLRLAQEATGVGVWEWDPVTGAVVLTPEVCALFGLRVRQGDAPRLGPFLRAVHPKDRKGLLRAARRAVRTGASDVEFRVIRSSGTGQDIRWLMSRARRIPDAEATGRLLGVNIDITERKIAEERQVLLMQELDHRAKNALAVVQAAVRLTPSDDPEAFRAAIIGRVGALARAHTLLAAEQWMGANIQDLVRAELAAFLTETPGTTRVETEGPALILTPAATQALSMALHELATNATKHGALATATGRVELKWWPDAKGRTLRLIWTEMGGPPLGQPPARRGFGSRVLHATLAGQLGGHVEHRWEASGLTVTVTLPLSRIKAQQGPNWFGFESGDLGPMPAHQEDAPRMLVASAADQAPRMPPGAAG